MKTCFLLYPFAHFCSLKGMKIKRGACRIVTLVTLLALSRVTYLAWCGTLTAGTGLDIGQNYAHITIQFSIISSAYKCFSCPSIF